MYANWSYIHIVHLNCRMLWKHVIAMKYLKMKNPCAPHTYITFSCMYYINTLLLCNGNPINKNKKKKKNKMWVL